MFVPDTPYNSLSPHAKKGQTPRPAEQPAGIIMTGNRVSLSIQFISSEVTRRDGWHKLISMHKKSSHYSRDEYFQSLFFGPCCNPSAYVSELAHGAPPGKRHDHSAKLFACSAKHRVALELLVLLEDVTSGTLSESPFIENRRRQRLLLLPPLVQSLWPIWRIAPSLQVGEREKEHTHRRHWQSL